MSALTTIVVVGALAWGASRLQRIARGAGRAAGRARAPAWPGEVSPPAAGPIEPAPAATVLVSAPRVQVTVRRSPDAPVAAVTQAQALAGQPPRGRYPLSSQPQRRRADRSARLFALAKGPGLCSPRTQT